MFGGENAMQAERSDVMKYLLDIITPKTFRLLLKQNIDDFKFSHMLTGRNKDLDSWISSAEKDAELANGANDNSSSVTLVRMLCLITELSKMVNMPKYLL